MDIVARELAPAGLRSSPKITAASPPSGSKLPRHNCALALALLGQGAALEFDDTLTVVLDGLCGQHAALVVFQLAVQLLDSLRAAATITSKACFG